MKKNRDRIKNIDFQTILVEGKQYATEMLIFDLKNELNKLIIKQVTDEVLSKYLGQKKGHIHKKKDQIRNNPNYLISKEILQEYKISLLEKLGDRARSLLRYIEKYEISNDLQDFITGVRKWHPNLNFNYFKKIDTLDKAYWLGWLFAEVWLSKHGKYIRFGVELHKDDESALLDKFAKTIGFNLEHKETEIRREGLLTEYVRIRFVSDDFANNLIRHGFIVGKKKSKSIVLPKLASRKFYLAFILGYYDGDGKVGSTVITSGSISFINQVKDHFRIPHKIWRTDSEWEGVGYNIYLGMDLMREMLANYKDSLHRKRRHFKK